MAAKYVILCLLCICPLFAHAGLEQVKARMAEDARRGKPFVAHVTVALCDNASQGIVPVGNGLCDGDAPSKNLYWGALYGVKSYFAKHKEWLQLTADKPADTRILERVVFMRTLQYDGLPVSVYLVADAWRGKYIRGATQSYMESLSRHQRPIALSDTLQVHGNAHVMAYIGHNGLMDFSVQIAGGNKHDGSPSSAIILACKSDAYFSEVLRQSNTHKLLTTSGFMAPEAYTLEAAISQWFSGGSPVDTHLAAAKSYGHYQKAKLSWSKNLFVFDP